MILLFYDFVGLEQESFRKTPKTVELINDPEISFSAFVRDPLERLISGYKNLKFFYFFFCTVFYICFVILKPKKYFFLIFEICILINVLKNVV